MILKKVGKVFVFLLIWFSISILLFNLILPQIYRYFCPSGGDEEELFGVCIIPDKIGIVSLIVLVIITFIIVFTIFKNLKSIRNHA